MLDLVPLIQSVLPHKHRKSASGWHQFHAVCCHHRGHNSDTRMRGNLKMDVTGISYSCFNCGFKTRFTGDQLSRSFEQLLQWLGMDATDIQKIKLRLLQQHMDEGATTTQDTFSVPDTNWPTVRLPNHSVRIQDALDHAPPESHVHEVWQYIQSRGIDLCASHDWYWSDQSDHDLHKRVLIPMTKHNQIVAYTGRYAGTPPPGVPKYYNSPVPPGYLFNWDRLWSPRKFVLLCEGPLDAIAVQGVASMGSTLSDEQIYHLSQSDKHVVVLPDRTKTNQQLIDAALAFGWSVSFPEWESHIKDAADACKAYGQIYTITSVLAARVHNPLTIGVKRKWMPQ
jgi:hypothetical protein